MGDALALAFFVACRLAKQFLQAIAGVESMTAAISPADNNLIVVIELPLWMQQTARDYPSRAELVCRMARRSSAKFLAHHIGRTFNYVSYPSSAIERGCSIEASHAQNCQLTSSDPAARVAIASFRIVRARFQQVLYAS
jgi:hypothetical protein